MAWYSAHIISCIRRVDGIGPTHVFENVYLISAFDDREAQDKSNKISNLEYGSYSDVTMNEYPTEIVFIGVRKINLISNPEPPQFDIAPYDGTELTYLQYEISSNEELNKLIAGDIVQVQIIE